LDRMAAYARRDGLAIRPHTKPHKSPWIAGMQVERGAAGLTVATAREAEVMASVTDDLLVAYPPVGRARIDALLAVADRTRVTVALDSLEALDAIATAAAGAGLEIGVLVELAAGMRRCGVAVAEGAVGRARIDALLAVADRTRVTVALDSLEALDAIATAAAGAGLEIGVLVELDVGMRRCGVTVPEEAVALAGVAASRAGVAYRGVMF